MPCVHTRCSSSPRRSGSCPQESDAPQRSGTGELLTPEFVKFSMELTNSELCGPGVLPPGGAISGYEGKPPCVFPMPSIKTEDVHLPVHAVEQRLCPHTLHFCHLPPQYHHHHHHHHHTPTWQDSYTGRRGALSGFSLLSLKHAQVCALDVSVTVDAHGLQSYRSGVCAVCGDNAACQHYGVRTCEGCKGFFKRTVQKNAQYVCLSMKSCPVDKRRRNRCQFCRFQKCLSVGMDREGVRMDSLKGRRGRLPSSQRAAADTTLLSSLIRAHMESNPQPSRYNSCKEQTVSPVDDVQQVCEFYQLLTRSMEVIRGWANKIPGFTGLPKHDQELLFYSAFLEVFVLRLSYRSDPLEELLAFCDGSVWSRRQCLRGFGEWIDVIVEFSSDLQRMKMDVEAFSVLCALVLVTERPGLQEPHRVRELRSRVTQCLTGKPRAGAVGCCSDQSAGMNKTLSDLRTLCVQGLQRIFYLKLEDLISPPAVIDKLFMDTLPF